MTFVLPDLPYRKDALAPCMSAETLEFHHGRHHQAYVDKTNELLHGKELSGASLVQLIRAANDKGDQALFDNAAQLWNHNFFWQCLAPPEGQSPSGRLKDMIDEGFGSPDAMLEKLTEEAVGHFSNGWAWLVHNHGKLEILSLHDADTPLVYEGMQPLLTLDLWEHAYYIDYRNERPKFVEAVLKNLVNWEFVAQNLDGRGADRADQEGSGMSSTERELETH